MSAYYFEVRNDFMSPMLRQGDRVKMFKTTPELLRRNEVCVIVTNNGGQLCRVQSNRTGRHRIYICYENGKKDFIQKSRIREVFKVTELAYRIIK